MAPSTEFTQKRGAFRTSFRFRPDALEHTLEQKREHARRVKVPWPEIGAPSSHERLILPDGALRWVILVPAALAIFAAWRDGPQPITLAVHAAGALVLLAGALLTRRWRGGEVTRIFAGERVITVLDDPQRATLLAEIESRRAGSLLAAEEDDAPQTVRERLRRLERLTRAEAIPAAEAEAERARLIGAEPAPAPDQSFRQRRAFESVTVTLGPDRLRWRGNHLFEGGREIALAYADLPEPAAEDDYDTGLDFVLAAGVMLWTFAIVSTLATIVTAGVPADHYVGGPGLPRAIADFGPLGLILLGGVALASVVARTRYAAPYPWLRLIADRQAPAIVAAVDARRVAALRAFARPNPARTLEEQTDVLDWLRRDGVITPSERAKHLEEARGVCEDPDLDRLAEEPPAAPARRALH
ncbi:hypothetical protein [Methylopila turkensis]|uniref:Uncharacterized protein n=1 Tax=Methylopila turkensis TaxID=1437816 RepID=A0A9W6JQ14_9HYPH|nr:hypothetical protein [Methylopila turkensis]GLK80204.1 hypothetical protein GCM10008174_19450 [Methylopila turkensis]